MIQRPNLAKQRFLDTRPVWLAAGALAVIAVVLTGLSVRELVSVQGDERALRARLESLVEKRARLRTEVEAANRHLATVPWKKLRTEATSLATVVAQRNFLWSVLLADLEHLLPWNTRLVSISPTFEKEGPISIALTGIATDRAAWLQLLARCFVDPHFSTPVPASETAPGATNAQGYRFQFSVTYFPEGRK